jgi:hypothetical protein
VENGERRPDLVARADLVPHAAAQPERLQARGFTRGSPDRVGRGPRRRRERPAGDGGPAHLPFA